MNKQSLQIRGERVGAGEGFPAATISQARDDAVFLIFHVFGVKQPMVGAEGGVLLSEPHSRD